MSTNHTQFQDHHLSTFTSLLHIPSTLPSITTNKPYYHHHHHHHHHQQQLPVYEFTYQSSSLSCNNSCTSDEAEDQHLMSIINERKQRRMISNRESARRSRMRKQRQLDELCTQLLRLRNENHGLIDRLNRLLETHEQVVQENDSLKKETIELKQLLSDQVQIAATTYNNNNNNNLGDHQEGDHEVVLASCTTDQSSNISTVTTSTTSDRSFI